MSDEPLFGLPADCPSIAEQREVRAHNAPIIEALSVAVTMARRLFGPESVECQAVCRVFDRATEIAGQTKRIGE